MSLVPIQTYTTNRAQLRKAIDEAATRATSVFDRDAIRSPTEQMVSQAAATFTRASRSSPVLSQRGDQPSEGPGARHIGGWAARSRHRHCRPWRSTGPRCPGNVSRASSRVYASLNALRAVIEGLSVLPGRKSVVFFAEGLALPEAVLPQFDSVVATANRANVSVYTVDAAGLRVHSKDAETGREVRAAGAQSMIVNPDGSTGGSLGALERIEDVLRKDPRTSLTLLADRTGGFLIENTNDLARGLPEDRRRPPFPLPAHLHTEEARVFRRVAARRGARALAEGRDPKPLWVSSGAPAVGDSAAGVRRPGAGGAGSHAAAGRPAAAPGRVRVSRRQRRLARGAAGGGQRARL